MITNFKYICNTDLWMSGKKKGKKFPGKLLPRKMSPENWPLYIPLHGNIFYECMES